MRPAICILLQKWEKTNKMRPKHDQKPYFEKCSENIYKLLTLS